MLQLQYLLNLGAPSVSTGPLVVVAAVQRVGLQSHKPGSSFRHVSVWTLLGVFVDPASPTCILEMGDGSTVAGILTRVSLGNWAADFVVPTTLQPSSIFVLQWKQTGAGPSQNAILEERHVLDPLDPP